jgi:hypothetical protein
MTALYRGSTVSENSQFTKDAKILQQNFSLTKPGNFQFDNNTEIAISYKFLTLFFSLIPSFQLQKNLIQTCSKKGNKNQIWLKIAPKKTAKSHLTQTDPNFKMPINKHHKNRPKNTRNKILIKNPRELIVQNSLLLTKYNLRQAVNNQNCVKLRKKSLWPWVVRGKSATLNFWRSFLAWKCCAAKCTIPFCFRYLRK